MPAADRAKLLDALGGGGPKPFATLIFSRHGESEWNVANKFTGSSAWNKKARLVGSWLLCFVGFVGSTGGFNSFGRLLAQQVYFRLMQLVLNDSLGCLWTPETLPRGQHHHEIVCCCVFTPSWILQQRGCGGSTNLMTLAHKCEPPRSPEQEP